ncbi:isochorismate synthase [Pseudactinotalea sp. Z1739]|uniref:isochorismate synthase n=1 Tax=Pseudactinotalea sp. Z1739 TaxID=3413028 RepID=UPI003C7D72E9
MSASVPQPASKGSPSLLVRTRELDTGGETLSDGDLIGLLPRPRADAAHLWLRRGAGLVGWGQVARFTSSGPDRFADAMGAWREFTEHLVVRDEVGLPGSGPVAFGAFTFAPATSAPSVLLVPEVVLGSRDGRTWITTVSPVDPVDEEPSLPPLGPAPTLAQLREQVSPLRPHRGVQILPGALDPDEWVEQVERVIARIRGGEVAKVVMAREEHVQVAEELDIRPVLTQLAHAYPTTWTFAVDGLIGATPELLVRRERGLVSSRVLAGTIPRTGDDEADLTHAASLARSSKDLEEHEFAVQSLMDSLRPVAASTNAQDAPFVLHLPNVMHLATDVTAVLATEHADLSSLDLAARLHPTAAVCGTPTPEAAEMIAEHEQMDRGRYAGPVGWIGADGDGEWGIALRCAQVEPSGRELRLFAGCGIVAASDPVAELGEAEAKLAPMRAALRI